MPTGRMEAYGTYIPVSIYYLLEPPGSGGISRFGLYCRYCNGLCHALDRKGRICNYAMLFDHESF